MRTSPHARRPSRRRRRTAALTALAAPWFAEAVGRHLRAPRAVLAAGQTCRAWRAGLALARAEALWSLRLPGVSRPPGGAAALWDGLTRRRTAQDHFRQGRATRVALGQQALSSPDGAWAVFATSDRRLRAQDLLRPHAAAIPLGDEPVSLAVEGWESGMYDVVYFASRPGRLVTPTGVWDLGEPPRQVWAEPLPDQSWCDGGLEQMLLETPHTAAASAGHAALPIGAGPFSGYLDLTTPTPQRVAMPEAATWDTAWFGGRWYLCCDGPHSQDGGADAPSTGHASGGGDLRIGRPPWGPDDVVDLPPLPNLAGQPGYSALHYLAGDGSWLVARDGNSLWVYDLAADPPRTRRLSLARLGRAAAAPNGVAHVSFSGDREVMVAATRTAMWRWTLGAGPAAPRRLTAVAAHSRPLALSHDGRSVLGAGRSSACARATHHPWIWRDGVDAAPRRLQTPAAEPPSYQTHAFALSHDGTQVAAINDGGRLDLWDVGAESPAHHDGGVAGQQALWVRFVPDGCALVVSGITASFALTYG